MKVKRHAGVTPVDDAEQRAVAAAVVENATAVGKIGASDHHPVALGSKGVVRQEAATDLGPVIRTTFDVFFERLVRVHLPRHTPTRARGENIAHQRRSNSGGVQSLPGAAATARLFVLADARSAGCSRKWRSPSSRPSRSAVAHT